MYRVRGGRSGSSDRSVITSLLKNRANSQKKEIATEVARVALQQPSAPKKRGAGQPITRRFYSTLVMLKLAGRSPREIAEIFGQTSERVQAHIARAMNEYRQGTLEVNQGESVSEARGKGKDDAVENIVKAFDLNEDTEEVQFEKGEQGGAAETPPPVQVEQSTDVSSNSGYTAKMEVATISTTGVSTAGLSVSA